jgi:hypothetical protein
VAHNPTPEKEQSMSTQSVSQESITSEGNVSALDPTKGASGLLGIREAVEVGLRRVGILISAVSHEEPLHPCLMEEDRNETIRAELTDLEAILQAIQTEAEAMAAEPETRGQA